MFRKTSYEDLMIMDLKKSYKPLKTKKHHETCPTCQRKLVNIYYSNGAWKCNQCWENLTKVMSVLGVNTDTYLPLPARKE